MKENHKKITYLKVILIVISILALGMLAVNQTLDYFYKTQFLKQPCELCIELNPQLSECFNTPKIKIPGTTFNLTNFSLIKT